MISWDRRWQFALCPLFLKIRTLTSTYRLRSSQAVACCLQCCDCVEIGDATGETHLWHPQTAAVSNALDMATWECAFAEGPEVIVQYSDVCVSGGYACSRCAAQMDGEGTEAAVG